MLKSRDASPPVGGLNTVRFNALFHPADYVALTRLKNTSTKCGLSTSTCVVSAWLAM